MMHLFSGAFGVFRKSQRASRACEDAPEAAMRILFANLLLQML